MENTTKSLKIGHWIVKAATFWLSESIPLENAFRRFVHACFLRLPEFLPEMPFPERVHQSFWRWPTSQHSRHLPSCSRTWYTLVQARLQLCLDFPMGCSIFYPSLMLLFLNLLQITGHTLKLQQEWLPVRYFVILQDSTPRLAPRLFTLHILGLANTVRRIIRISYIGGTCLVGWLHTLRLPSLSFKMTDRYEGTRRTAVCWFMWSSCRGYSLHRC